MKSFKQTRKSLIPFLGKGNNMSNRKERGCPNCSPNGKLYFHLEYSDRPTFDEMKKAVYENVSSDQIGSEPSLDKIMTLYHVNNLDQGRETRKVWECQNCRFTLPYHPKVRIKKIGKAQEARVEYFKKAVFEHDAFGDQEKYEIKVFDVERKDDLIFLKITTGMKNDDHTMASVFCRPTRLIMITQNGGCQLLNAKKGEKTKGVWNCVHALIER